MLKSPRILLFSLLTLAVGVIFHLSRATISDASKVRSSEDYWAETGLGPAALEDLLQDKTCVSSERYFLACTNAILNIANRFNMSLSPTGDLVPVAEAFSSDTTSEKAQLQNWKNFYSAEPQKASQISFLQAWKKLEQRYVKKSQKAMIVGLGLNGFISVFRDPHTYLMPVAHFREVVSKADNRSTSLGMTLGLREGHYVVRKITEGSPAKVAGLQRGDILLAINDKSVKGLIQGRVTELLRGEVGDMTSVRISRGDRILKFKLRRTEIVVATVSTQVIDGIKPLGVIAINKFAKGACQKVKTSLQTLSKARVRGFLLDLRDNPGGQLEEAACISSLFVGTEKMIFEVRHLDPRKKPEIYYGEEKQMTDLPLAILINSSSASASEVVAGSLRDLNRAILVGERTFGKGSFQEGEFWSQNKKIAIFETKGFYYLPSGRSPQMTGLEPDVVVNFDKLNAPRESDLYLNPLHAPEQQIRVVGKRFSTEECLDLDEGETSDDLQLVKAKQVLFCSQATARAGL